MIINNSVWRGCIAVSIMVARQLPLQCVGLGTQHGNSKCIGSGEILIPKQSHTHKQGRNRTQKNAEPILSSITDYVASYMAVESNTNLRKHTRERKPNQTKLVLSLCDSILVVNFCVIPAQLNCIMVATEIKG